MIKWFSFRRSFVSQWEGIQPMKIITPPWITQNLSANWHVGMCHVQYVDNVMNVCFVEIKCMILSIPEFLLSHNNYLYTYTFGLNKLFFASCTSPWNKHYSNSELLWFPGDHLSFIYTCILGLLISVKVQCKLSIFFCL